MNEEFPVAVVRGAVLELPRPRAAPVATPAVTEEQLAYAQLLDGGMKLGLLGLVVTFLVYVSGALSARIPVQDLPRYWSMPVKEYLAATGVHPGWGWVGLIGHGDFLNFIGIAFLAGVSLVCYLAIVPIFVRKKDFVYAALSVVEVAVLALAASGVLNVGAH
jgi:hypothetical protein